ncbi:MAG: hypothetical protein QME13_04995, partial [Thermoanaerobacteraceae bacterium]|nr:hypothetical protein [Thermoanaerobacteraceae bacterium]
MPLKSLRAQIIILLVIVLVVYALVAFYATTSILKSCVPDTTSIRHMIQTLMLSKMAVLAGLIVILSLFISLAFSRWLSPLHNISNTLIAIAKGDYDRPIDPPCYAEFQGIVEAAERMRLDIKETFNRLNNLSSFGMRAVSLVKEEEAYQLLVHYLKRT